MVVYICLSPLTYNLILHGYEQESNIVSLSTYSKRGFSKNRMIEYQYILNKIIIFGLVSKNNDIVVLFLLLMNIHSMSMSCNK